ncbi:MAG: hypothetical protein IPM70_14150 [Proteobacteria bacterium]|nr:hypothetical protein [Pseudomonadota bacterium]
MPSSSTVLAPTAAQVERATRGLLRIELGTAYRAVQRCGSDLQTQVLKDLGIEFVAGQSRRGSSFEGIQESIVNYGTPPNVMPEFLTALHEENLRGHGTLGYGGPKGGRCARCCTETIGLQHASMAIYQAYYSGNADADHRRPRRFASSRRIPGTTWLRWCAALHPAGRAAEATGRILHRAPEAPIGGDPATDGAATLVVLDMETQKAEAGALQVPRYATHHPRIDGTTRRIAQEIVLADCCQRTIRRRSK